MSEQYENAVQTSGAGKRCERCKWSSTYALILGCAKPPWEGPWHASTLTGRCATISKEDKQSISFSCWLLPLFWSSNLLFILAFVFLYRPTSARGGRGSHRGDCVGSIQEVMLLFDEHDKIVIL